MDEEYKVSVRSWKILFRYLLEYRRDIVLLSVLGVASALANASVPFLVGQFFDALLQPATVFSGTRFQAPFWLSILILWFVTQAVANVADWVNDVKSRRIGTLTHTSYVSRAAGHLLYLPVPFHREHKTGETWDKIERAGQ